MHYPNDTGYSIEADRAIESTIAREISIVTKDVDTILWDDSFYRVFSRGVSAHIEDLVGTPCDAFFQHPRREHA
jgi:hypothetical protein